MVKFIPLRVIRHQPEAEDALRIALAVPAEHRDTFNFTPGQHVALRAMLDGEEVRRTYSLVSAPGCAVLEIVPRVLPDGRMSNHLARDIKVGDSIEVLAPSGGFHVQVASDARKTYVAFAAGCGITPVYSILAQILTSEPTSRCILFYGNRTSARAMLLEDLMALKNRNMGRLILHFVMSGEPQDVALWNGRLDGTKVRELAGRVFDPKPVDEYLLCLPAVDEVKEALIGLGVDGKRIHSEHFFAVHASAQPAPRPVRPTAQAEMATIIIVMDGRRRQFSMAKDADTILDAANAAGFDLPFSCRAGVCSTCRTKVTRGEVRMSEQYALEDWELEAGYRLACSSKPVTNEVELDYDDR
jgi:ring-1,2-phenylacetyl-CoA epoxidase subunit PaaE